MIRAVFPGTFDPIHYGHIDIANRAARLFDEIVIAVFDQPLKHLLFSPEERIELVRTTFADQGQYKVIGYRSLTVELCQRINAQVIVRGLRVFSDFEYEFRMALTNHRLAPEIEVITLITSEEHSFLSSSTVREVASLGGDITAMVPRHVSEAVVRRFKELGDDGPRKAQFTSLRD